MQCEIKWWIYLIDGLLQVLKTIPWDKVDIEVVTVETNHAGEVFPGSKEEIREYMADQGYVYVYTVESKNTNDLKHNI